MAPHITSQTILFPATRSGVVEQGTLVFADDTLMAVFVLLDRSVEGDLRGHWFLEAGFGPCAGGPAADHLFRSVEEAQQWVLERVTRERENRGPQFA